MNDVTKPKQAILDGVADSWSPNQMREMASSLLRLADSIDQKWEPAASGSIFKWPGALSRIERNAYNLALKSKLIYDKRTNRSKFISSEMLGEPAWDMLLELFMQYAGGAKVSTTSLCIASRVPVTTALRYVKLLEDAGLIEKSLASYDRRVTLVSLTEKGAVSVGAYLEQY